MGGPNDSAPSLITPNNQSNLSQSYTYNSFLGVTSATGPNSSTVTTAFDSYTRPTSTTSPHGAVTDYTYNNAERTATATTNGRWTRTTTDGLGRTIKVETGYGATTVSTVDTEYDSCGCSPLGKVKRVSQPYAPNGTVYWTVYSYDCLGRTVSVTQPGNSGASTYVYEGNTVTMTNPAGKWKKYTTDALGNLVQVTEPDPALGNVQTNYTYNRRGQLTLVSMPRGGSCEMSGSIPLASVREKMIPLLPIRGGQQCRFQVNQWLRESVWLCRGVGSGPPYFTWAACGG
jgi:YD repeat-containing protein